MFKTNSRKGMSLAAIVALAASLFVGGAPAQAAGEVSLVTAKGTTYAALAGTTFELTVNAGSTIPQSSWLQLKTKITNTGATTYSATASATTGATFTGSTSNTKSALVLKPTAVSTTLSAYTVAVSTVDSSSNAVLTIQSWLDADGDDVVDSGEFVSDERVVTFYKTSAVTWSTAFSAPVLSAAPQTLSAVVSTAEGINMHQLPTGKVQIGFATYAAPTYSAHASASNTIVSTAGLFSQGQSASPVTGTTTTRVQLAGVTVVASATYVAQAIVDGAEFGAEQVALVGSAAVSAIETLEVTEDANFNGDNVRVGTAVPVELTAVVSKSAGVKAAAGTLVTVTVTQATLATSSAVVGGGKTLNGNTAGDAKIEFTVAVAADGTVTIPLTATLKNGEGFKVKLTADNVASSEVTVTAATTAFGQIKNLTTFGVGSIVKVAAGASATLKFAVVDNFDEPLKGDYRIYLNTNNGSLTTSAAVTGDVVSFNVTPSKTTEYYATVQKLNTSTLAYDNSGTPATQSVTVGASNAAGAVTLVATSASNLALNNAALKAVDTRNGGTAPKLTTGNRATLSGQVTDANGIATYGVVTLTAADAMFVVGDVYTLGSVTVETNASGAYDGVVVYRNKAGKVTVSATVGSATKDLGLSYVAAAETAGAKWVVTAPATAVPGTTAQFKAQLLDTWSNPVKVTTTSYIAVKYTGPGFVTGTLPTTTDATGELSFSVLFGSNDTGTATVTFAYDGDADSTTTTNNVALAASTVVAVPAVVVPEVNAAIGTFNGRVAVRVENAKGAVVSVKIGGKWFKYTSLNDNYLFSRKSVKGRTVPVAVYVNGTLENVATITVK
jgi:hypothetical protein